MGISGHKQVVGMQDLQVLTTFYLFHPFWLAGGGGGGYRLGIRDQVIQGVG